MSNQQTELSAPTTSIMNVTPDQAASWLAENNVHNRTLRESRVAQYARDMEADHWQFNGDPIRFAIDGTLLDGQHRLSAIMRSGATVPMVVIWGLSNQAQETMDIGAARSMADALSLRGEQAAKYLAAIARKMVQFDRGVSSDGGGGAPTFAEMHVYIGANPEIRRAVEVAQRAQGARLPAPPSSIGSAYFACARRDVPDAETFFITQLVECIGLREGDAARALLRRFQNENLAGRQMHPDDVFRYSIQAWNHFRAGNSITKLQAPPGGWGPKNMPVPR
jgi:hypothetical protein